VLSDLGVFMMSAPYDRRRVFMARNVLENRRAGAAVIVPACDEELLLPRLLDSLSLLTGPKQPPGDATTIVVLVCANNCRDSTADVVRARGERIGGLELAVVEGRYDPPNVGLVRAEAAVAAFEAGCRWIQFTDADVTIPNTDFLTIADRLSADQPDACFGGWCDEFGDVLAGLSEAAAPEAVAYLEFARDFRCRWLPKHDGLFRYTDGANTLVTARGYEAAGGYEPKAVGGDSTLGDRFLEATGRFPGFFDRPVVPSARKCWAMGRVGGFIFYPLDRKALQKVRSCKPPAELDAAAAFEAAAYDLFDFLLFVAGQRHAWLQTAGNGLVGLGRRVEEAYAVFAAERSPPVSVALRGHTLVLAADDPALPTRTLRLAWDTVDRFWRTGARE
jgi:hypothetical protein